MTKRRDRWLVVAAVWALGWPALVSAGSTASGAASPTPTPTVTVAPDEVIGTTPVCPAPERLAPMQRGSIY